MDHWDAVVSGSGGRPYVGRNSTSMAVLGDRVIVYTPDGLRRDRDIEVLTRQLAKYVVDETPPDQDLRVTRVVHFDRFVELAREFNPIGMNVAPIAPVEGYQTMYIALRRLIQPGWEPEPLNMDELTLDEEEEDGSSSGDDDEP